MIRTVHAFVLGAALALAYPTVNATSLQQVGQPESSIATMQNYGMGVTTAKGLTSVVPEGWRTFVHRKVSLPDTMSWSVGDAWPDVLAEMARQGNVSVLVDWHEKAVYVRPLEVAKADEETRAEITKAAVTPLPAFTVAKVDHLEKQVADYQEALVAQKSDTAALTESFKSLQEQLAATKGELSKQSERLEETRTAALAPPLVAPSGNGVAVYKGSVMPAALDLVTPAPATAPDPANYAISTLASPFAFAAAAQPSPAVAAPADMNPTVRTPAVSGVPPATPVAKVLPSVAPSVSTALAAQPVTATAPATKPQIAALAAPTPAKATKQDLVAPLVLQPALQNTALAAAPVSALAVAASASNATLSPAAQPAPLLADAPVAVASGVAMSAQQNTAAKPQADVFPAVATASSTREADAVRPALAPVAPLAVEQKSPLSTPPAVATPVAARSPAPPVPDAVAPPPAQPLVPLTALVVAPAVPVVSPGAVSQALAEASAPAKSAGQVKLPSAEDFAYTAPVGLNRPSARTTAQGIANRFHLRLVWAAQDVKLRGPVTLLGDNPREDITLLAKALGLGSPLRMEMPVGEGLLIASDGSMAIPTAAEIAASTPKVTEAVVVAASKDAPNGKVDQGQAGATTVAAVAAAPAPAEVVTTPAAAPAQLTLVLPEGQPLEVAISQFAHDNGFTVDWKVPGGFQAKHELTYVGSSVQAVLAQVLPPLSVSADIYKQEAHIVVRPWDAALDR